MIQLTWDTYDRKFCVVDRDKVCFKEVCHEARGVSCCLACRKCNGWTSCPEEMQTCFVHRDEPKTCPRYAKDCDVCEYDEEEDE